LINILDMGEKEAKGEFVLKTSDIEGRDNKRLPRFYMLGVLQGFVIDEAETKRLRGLFRNNDLIILKIKKGIDPHEGPTDHVMALRQLYHYKDLYPGLGYKPNSNKNAAEICEERFTDKYGPVVFTIGTDVAKCERFFPTLASDLARAEGDFDSKVFRQEFWETSDMDRSNMKIQAFIIVTGE